MHTQRYTCLALSLQNDNNAPVGHNLCKFCSLKMLNKFFSKFIFFHVTFKDSAITFIGF